MDQGHIMLTILTVVGEKGLHSMEVQLGMFLVECQHLTFVPKQADQYSSGEGDPSLSTLQ